MATDKTPPGLASSAEGRVISMSFRVKLIPPQDGALGETEPAMEIGRGLIREAMLKNTGEAEGFAVEVEAQQTVY